MRSGNSGCTADRRFGVCRGRLAASRRGAPMPDVAGPPGAAEPPRPSPGAAGAELAAPAVRRAGWGVIALFAAAYLGATLQLLAPLVVTLALKVDSLVGSARAPNSLALVTGVGAFLALFANPFFGKLSDRTAGPYGMRR